MLLASTGKSRWLERGYSNWMVSCSGNCRIDANSLIHSICWYGDWVRKGSPETCCCLHDSARWPLTPMTSILQGLCKSHLTPLCIPSSIAYHVFFKQLMLTIQSLTNQRALEDTELPAWNRLPLQNLTILPVFGMQRQICIHPICSSDSALPRCPLWVVIPTLF